MLDLVEAVLGILFFGFAENDPEHPKLAMAVRAVAVLLLVVLAIITVVIIATP